MSSVAVIGGGLLGMTLASRLTQQGHAITIFEAVTALASILAVLTLLVGFTGIMPTLALSLAAVTLLMLFGGQRFSKDYAGAGTLAIYFAVAVVGLLAIGLPR